jgi:COX assembly protein 1
MAAMARPPVEVEEAPRLPMPSRNPLPLSAGQEAQVRELYHSRVRGYCAAEIKRLYASYMIFIPMLKLVGIEFADCALGRTFTAPFKCRQQNRAMNNCMVSHATQAEQDAAREEWFATRLKRQKEREAKEARRKEQERFHREWWGLPIEDREGDKGRDIMKRAERVGGFPKSDENQLSKDRHR